METFKAIDTVAIVARKLMPPAVRDWIKAQLPFAAVEKERRARMHPLAHEPEVWEASGSPVRLAILKEYYSYHKDFVYACRELGISYRLVDISASDWIHLVTASGCDAILAWPSALPLVWNSLFDDRLRILQENLGFRVYPSIEECWLYESKLRARDWLDANGIPHPRTWVFFDRDEALQFADSAPLPLVSKTNTGASGSGVSVLHSRRQVRKQIHTSFGRGILPRGQGRTERQRGFAYLQEYLPEANEWRMVRIGDSFFGYRKERGASGLHSASKSWTWLDPPRPLLDLLLRVTEEGGFTSMNVDVFETRDGRLLVNELQTVFGATTPVDQMRIDNRPGRYRLQDGGWVFEEGDFCRNACSNLRVQYVVEQLLGGRIPNSEWCRLS